MKILIENGRVIDPASGRDERADVTIAAGRILGIGRASPDFAPSRRIDASGCIVAPGLVDLAARLGEPGQEHARLLESELAAAVAGGVTSLVCPPDTDPVLDESGLVDMLKTRAEKMHQARVFPLGALTARQLRTLAAVYPSPPGWDDPTAYLDLMVTPSAVQDAEVACRGKVRTSEATVRPNGRPVVTAPARRDVTVLVGRFGEEPAAVADVPAGRSVELVLDGAGLTDPWTVVAPAGCITPG